MPSGQRAGSGRGSMRGEQAGGRRDQRNAQLDRGVSFRSLMPLEFQCKHEQHLLPVAQLRRAGCSLTSPGAGLHTQDLLCGIRREATKFSSLQCQKRQALICKARRPYQELRYLQGSRAVSKGSRRCLYFFHFPDCHILYLLFISVKPQSKTDGFLPETWMC